MEQVLLSKLQFGLFTGSTVWYFINIDILCQVTVGSMHHSLTLSRVNHVQNPPENQEIRHQKTIMENILTRYLRFEQNLCFSLIQAKFG